MKKLLMFFAALFITMSAFAGSDLKVTNGDKKYFKKAEKGDVVVEISFEGATYDDRMPLADKWSVDYLTPIAISGFTQNWNDESKVGRIVKDSSAAKYKIVLHVKKMDQYIKVMGFVPGPATKAWGEFTIIKIATGEVCVDGLFEEVNGGANPSPDESISDCFEELGEQLAKLR